MGLVAHVFGKHGCAKCAVLRRRLDRALQDPRYAGVSVEYHDVLTLDGIVAFCKADTLNPNRIPALLMARDGRYVQSDAQFAPPEDLSVYAPSCTFQHVGVQTDYDGPSRGVITEDMIRRTLDRALV